MRKRFIGPANPDPATGEDRGHAVTVAGRYVGTVRPGEVLEVPADLADPKEGPAPAWSTALWEDVRDAPTKTSKQTEGEG